MAGLPVPAEPALSELLDDFLAAPLNFGSTKAPGQGVQELHGAALLAPPFLGGQLATPPQPPQQAGQPPDCLSARSFTDVLATVAADWHPAADPAQAWGASFLNEVAWPAHPPAAPPPGQRQPSHDCSSNTSADAAPLKQEEQLSSAAAARAAPPDSDGDSAGEPASERRQQPASAGGRARGTAAGRAEQRRVRKREKDRIEELQAAVAQQTEELEVLAAQTDDLAARLQEKDEELRKLRAAEASTLPAAEDDRLAASFEGTLRLTIEQGREVVLTAEQIRGLPPEDIRRLWGQYVARLRQLLQAARAPGRQAAASLQLAASLQREAVILLIRSAVVNTGATKSLFASGRADGGAGGAPPPHFWQQVAEELQLGAEQRGRMAELWAAFSARVGALMEVRRSIHAHVRATIPDGVFGRSFAVNFLKAHELCNALTFNLRQEHILLCDLAAAFHRLLSPAQNAACMVAAWPWWPNAPRIAQAAARAAGQPDAAAAPPRLSATDLGGGWLPAPGLRSA